MTMALKVRRYNPWNVNSDLVLNTCKITQSKANDVNLASNAKNLPLRRAGPKVPQRESLDRFLDNEMKLTGSDLVEGGP